METENVRHRVTGITAEKQRQFNGKEEIYNEMRRLNNEDRKDEMFNNGFLRERMESFILT